MSGLGLGIGWRDELAAVILRRADLGFVEIVAESFPERRRMPVPIEEMRRRGVAVIPHGLRLSLGGAERPDPERLAALSALVQRVEAPLVSEHVAFVRANGREAGHLLPVPRTRDALNVVVDNVRAAMADLPVPLALEPIATLVEWPDAELDEGAFLTEVLERTEALLLLDVANLYANARNHGGDAGALLDRLPLERIAYVHVAGGVEVDGLYHDTHAHPVPAPVLDLLSELASRVALPAAMLERDHCHPPAVELEAELDAIALAAGLADRTPSAGRAFQRGWPRSPSPAKRPSPTCAAAARLQALEADLLDVILDGGSPPTGFDPAHVIAAGSSLARKRSADAARR